MALAISANANQTVIPHYPGLSATDEAELRRIFVMCDVNKTRTIDKRELIKALRKHKDVAEFFRLPETIRQEDGSRDAMEDFFQGVDTNDDREMSWDELKNFLMKQRGSTAAATSTAEPATAIENQKLKALPAPENEAAFLRRPSRRPLQVWEQPMALVMAIQGNMPEASDKTKEDKAIYNAASNLLHELDAISDAAPANDQHGASSAQKAAQELQDSIASLLKLQDQSVTIRKMQNSTNTTPIEPHGRHSPKAASVAKAMPVQISTNRAQSGKAAEKPKSSTSEASTKAAAKSAPSSSSRMPEKLKANPKYEGNRRNDKADTPKKTSCEMEDWDIHFNPEATGEMEDWDAWVEKQRQQEIAFVHKEAQKKHEIDEQIQRTHERHERLKALLKEIHGHEDNSQPRRPKAQGQKPKAGQIYRGV